MLCSEEREELSPPTVVVAKTLAPAEQCHEDGYKEAEHSKPGVYYIEKADREIYEGDYPHLVFPTGVLNDHWNSPIVIAEAGHVAAHFEHPTQTLGSTSAHTPFSTMTAPAGQTSTHAPHATHSSRMTFAFFLLILISAAKSSLPKYAQAAS